MGERFRLEALAAGPPSTVSWLGSTRPLLTWPNYSVPGAKQASRLLKLVDFAVQVVTAPNQIFSTTKPRARERSAKPFALPIHTACFTHVSDLLKLKQL